LIGRVRGACGQGRNCGEVFWGRRGVRSGFGPRRGKAAAFAKAEDVAVDGVDVFFNFVLLNLLPRLAERAREGEAADLRFVVLGRGKFHAPEVEVGVHEGDAMNIAAGLAADLADEAHFGFFRRAGETERENFVRREAVFGKHAGAVAAEHNGFGPLGKDFAGSVGTEQNDGEFFGDATAAASAMHDHSPWSPWKRAAELTNKGAAQASVPLGPTTVYRQEGSKPLPSGRMP
jgi:hypothetical protein